MARYAAYATRTASATLDVATVLSTAALRRGKLYELTVGCSGAPADNVFQWQVARITASGTNTPLTPVPLDPADGVAINVWGSVQTVAATYAAILPLLVIDLNQRATFRWVAAPYGELVHAGGAAVGLGLKTPVAAAALAIDATLHYEEQ
jgi:hypothetical protein